VAISAHYGRVAVQLAKSGGTLFMAVVTSGELIRMMNYIDDISTTLRRVTANFTFMTDEEKKRLAEYMRKSEPNYVKVLEQLESGK
jgi:hypothetical protein